VICIELLSCELDSVYLKWQEVKWGCDMPFHKSIIVFFIFDSYISYKCDTIVFYLKFPASVSHL
jgi:hypothetical protein